MSPYPYLSTLSIAATPPSSRGVNFANVIFPTKTNCSSTNITTTSMFGPTEWTDQDLKAHITMSILVAVLAFSLILFIGFYFLRRSRQKCKQRHNQRQRELEDGKREVAEARAMWHADDTLKKGTYSTKRFQSPNPFMVAVHPLYHPTLKRSRTLPSTRSTHHIYSRFMSYPNPINREILHFWYPESPSSEHSHAKSKSIAISSAPIIPPQTPKPTYRSLNNRPRPSSDPLIDSQNKSFWSISSTNSIVSSSSSISGLQSFTTSISQTALRAPPPAHYPPTSLSAHTSLSSDLEDPELVIDIRSIPVNRADSPTLQPNTPLKDFPAWDDSSAAVHFNVQPISQYKLRTSQAWPLRPPTRPLPRSPESSVLLSNHLRIPLKSASKCEYDDIDDIERWLEVLSV